MPQPHDSDFAVDEVAEDIARLRIAVVNVYLIGSPAGGGRAVADWVLVDAGLAHGAAEILRVAAERFGVESRPAAIVLTHGHFDHVGALESPLAVWDVPVYAHVAELPFLTGRANFPPPDATVGAGVLARVAPAEPGQGIDLGDRVQALPATGRVPGMPSWRWIHTPGHSPGSITFYNKKQGFVVAGDVLFYGSIGRTDLPGGDHDLLMRSIFDKLLPLGDDTKVLPGHMDLTTIGKERATNPFILEYAETNSRN